MKRFRVFWLGILGFSFAFLILVTAPKPVYAAPPIPPGCPGSQIPGEAEPGVCEAIPPGCPGAARQGPPAPGVECPYENRPPTEQEACQGQKGTYLAVPLNDGTRCIPEGGSLDDNPIFVYLRPAIQFLSVGAGLVIVLMIVISGIRYITSSGNPQALQAAKSLLGKAVVALLAFIFMMAIFNFIVPGGIIG